MWIISRKALREFWRLHPDAEQPLRSWYAAALKARWSGPAEVKDRFPSASILKGNRVVFNVKGNAYRLVVKINYAYGVVYVRFVGSHATYDRIDAETV